MDTGTNGQTQGTATAANSTTITIDGMDMKYLVADRARELMSVTQHQFEQTLAVIRSKADNQISEAAKKHKGHIIFSVPKNIYGHPNFNQQSMGRELAKWLFKDGYSVKGTPLVFTITWAKDYDNSRPLATKKQNRPSPSKPDAEQQTQPQPTTNPPQLMIRKPKLLL